MARWRIVAGAVLAVALGAAAGAALTLGRTARAGEPKEGAPAAGTTATAALPRLAAQVGKKRVVLDPGHGGSNTGCAGVIEGVYEKRVTLVIAEMVAAELRGAGVEVVLTREDDRYLTLRERGRLANAAEADLFVSVHANASPGRAQRGFETWVLTPEALDVDAHAIRTGDGPARAGAEGENAEIGEILDDVERGAAHAGSVRLAGLMQTRLSDVWGADRSRGVRQGAQDVLMGLNMPGALVEVGFLDHPVEGARLLEHETRVAIAHAIALAVLDALADS